MTLASVLGHHIELKDLRLQNVDLHYSDHVNWKPILETIRRRNTLDRGLSEDWQWTTEMDITRGACLEDRCRREREPIQGLVCMIALR
jgi:hypothetical protein